MILSLLLGIIRIPRLWVTENSTRKHLDVLFSSFSRSSFPTIFTSFDNWTTSSPPLTHVRTANSSELRRLRVVWLAVPLDTLGELICISVRGCGCTKYYTHEYEMYGTPIFVLTRPFVLTSRMWEFRILHWMSWNGVLNRSEGTRGAGLKVWVPHKLSMWALPIYPVSCNYCIWLPSVISEGGWIEGGWIVSRSSRCSKWQQGHDVVFQLNRFVNNFHTNGTVKKHRVDCVDCSLLTEGGGSY